MKCELCEIDIEQPNISADTRDYVDNGHAIIRIQFKCDRCGYPMLTANIDAQEYDGRVLVSDESYYTDNEVRFGVYSRRNRDVIVIERDARTPIGLAVKLKG